MHWKYKRQSLFNIERTHMSILSFYILFRQSLSVNVLASSRSTMSPFIEMMTFKANFKTFPGVYIQNSP